MHVANTYFCNRLESDHKTIFYPMFQFVDKLQTKGERTLVYPEEVREAVRQRFGDPPDAGAYDRQYTDKVITVLHYVLYLVCS